MQSRLSSLLAIALAFSISGCASSVKKFDYPPTTNATSEIQRLEEEMAAAQRNQVDVLSPNQYADAKRKLDDAKKENQKQSSNEEVLENLGYARAHLETANAVSHRVGEAMPEVVKARSEALSAGAARLRSADLIDADKALRKTTDDFESGNPMVSADRRGELAKKYIDVEVAATKTNYLGEAKALIEAGKKLGAKKYAESKLVSAEAKYQSAEKTIETDRHNIAGIVKDSNAAVTEAKHMMEITRLAKGIKNQTPEEAAIALDAKRNEAARNEGKLQTARTTISEKNAEMSAMGADNSRLAGKERFNEALANAQKNFSSDEAEVYRQGDNLVVRLKTMQFPSGRSDLPGASMNILSKVKDVIASLDAEKVTVEGHTDAIGSKEKNQILSEKRAQTVAKYFASETVLPSEQIEAKGYGDTRPLATNKSSDGRAQNRRVDVVISPKEE